MDDIGPCLHSPSYAHSSEMHTHVGTIPRSQTQRKSCRSMKEKKSKEERGEAKEKRMNGGKSQWKAEEHVQHSPLLLALSNQSLTSLDQPLSPPAASRLLPCTPAPGSSSPLTSTPDPGRKPPAHTEVLVKSKDVSEADECVRKPSNMAVSGAKAASPQDLYVPMDPIYESAHTQMGAHTKSQRGVSAKQETTKSAKNPQEVDINGWVVCSNDILYSLYH